MSVTVSLRVEESESVFCELQWRVGVYKGSGTCHGVLEADYVGRWREKGKIRKDESFYCEVSSLKTEMERR